MSGLRSCLAVAAVLMLAACAGVANPFAVPATGESPPPGPAAAEQTGPAPAQKPAPKPTRNQEPAAPHSAPDIDVPRDVSRNVSRDMSRAALSPGPPISLADLKARIKGMEKTAIARLLGEPSFIRRDDPAEIWQYRGERCILDIFMYRDGNSFTAAHVTLRSRTIERPADEECYANIFARGKTG
ncbi:MAG: hypothetical protein OXH94_00485 [Rhodospirillales bacterium]|nr:hypothetical protein [Rhodospirillales bacterium]